MNKTGGSNLELNETKEQLAYRKSKTESFINKDKETRKELERLRQYSNAVHQCRSSQCLEHCHSGGQ